MLNTFTPSELELKKSTVFISVAEETLLISPNANIAALLNANIKPNLLILKKQVRNERIGRNKK